MRLAEVEEGTLTATPLEEVICAEQGADSKFSDALSVHGVRFRKAPKAIPVPTNGEELRARFKTLTIAFVIASFKQCSCPLAQDCLSRGLRGICGTPSQRARGQLPTGSGGTLSEGHLGNGARLRSTHEDARSQIYTVQRPRLASAMTQAMSDPTVRVRHFTTPTALLTTAEGKGHQTSVASANVPS